VTISDNMSDTKMPKNAEKYVCENCDFKCNKKSNYSSHLLTAKHKLMTNDDDKNAENAAAYICDCGKSYKHRQGLSLHKKKCVQKTPETAKNVNRVLPNSHIFITEHDDTSMADTIQSIVNAKVEEQLAKMGDPNITRLIEAQAVRDEAQAKRDEAAAEQTRLLIEAISLKGPQCIMNNTTNNNNQFNLNVFLNEDCKDAFTLNEVMESIVCTVSDLDRMDHDGYAATITRKILESMQNMLITERPIHCTDSRRNTVCVKNETGWEKNDKAMKLLMDSVYYVGRKLGGMIQDWQKAYPDHYHGTESRRKQYHRLVDDVMSVIDKSVEDQIASKVCKGVILDRKAAMDR